MTLLVEAFGLGLLLVGSWLILEACVEMDRPRKRRWKGER